MSRMYRIGRIILTLLLVCSLYGCQAQKSSVESVIETISNDKDSKVNPKMDDVILRIGKTMVTYREVLFYMYLEKNQYEQEFGAEIWDLKLQDNKELRDIIKGDILIQLNQIKVMVCESKAQNISLNKEEEQNAIAKAEEILHNMTAEEKEKFGVQEKIVKKIYKDNAQARKLYDKVVEEASAGDEDSVYQNAYKKWSKDYPAEVCVELWKAIEL